MTATQTDSNRRRDGLIAAGLLLALFAVYAFGACRTIYVGDSGELVTAAYVLGIPHPSGYPLYVLLAKVWSLLVPVGSIAFRLSLFSGACAAAAGAVLFIVGRRLGLGIWASLTAALCLAFGPSFWSEATVQRVYALNGLFVAMATLFACGWYRHRSVRLFVATIFTGALGASNHMYMVVYTVAFGLFALLTDFAFVLRPRVIAMSVAAVFCGLLPYLYLPIAASFSPPLAWGDPSSLEGFLDSILRRDFRSRAWAETPSDLLVVTADFAVGIARELAWGGVALVLVALVGGWRRRWPLLLMVLVMLGNVAVMALHGGPRDLFIWHRYFIPSYCMAALLAGIGAEVLFGRAPRALRMLPLVIPMLLLVSGWQKFDRSDYHLAEDFSRELLAQLPPGATLAAADDNVLFVLLYLRLVEGVRSDVNVVLHGTVPVPPSADYDPRAEPYFFTHNPSLRTPDLEAIPLGLAFRVWPRGAGSPAFALPPDEMPGADDPNLFKDHDTQNLIGHYYLMRGFSLENRDWPRARRSLENAAREAPDHHVLFQNLGGIYLRNGLFDESVAAFRRVLAIRPRGPEALRTSQIIEQLETEAQRLAAVEEQLRREAALEASEGREYHLEMSRRLQRADEVQAARGHYLRALEAGALADG